MSEIFSVKIWFLVLLINRSLCEEKIVFDISFDNIHDFVVNLGEASRTLYDFVINTQAIFCPERPICSHGGVQQREDILTRLPQDVLIGNKSVKMEEIKSLVGICCLAYSCSETCFRIGNCCPTKLVIANDTADTSSIGQHSGYRYRYDIGEVLTEHIAATVKSYYNKAVSMKHHKSFLMITNCISSYSNSILEQTCMNPSAYSMHDVKPVTSQKTGLTYWNSHCAECNNDIENNVPWPARAEFEHGIVFFANTSGFAYPGSIEELYDRVARMEDIIFTPPIPMENQMCMRRTDLLTLHERTRVEIINGSRFLFEACQLFIDPVFFRGSVKTHPYRNIYCFLSQQIQMQSKKELSNCLNEEYFRAVPRQMTALLDLSETPKTSKRVNMIGHGRPKLSHRRCLCDKIFDDYLVIII